MKTVGVVFGSLTDSNGVARAAVAMANLLAESEDFKVVLKPLYRGSNRFSGYLHPSIEIRPFLNFYFSGLSSILDLIPARILYQVVFKNQIYDIEIGYQFGLSTKIVSASTNKNSRKLAWVHGYDYGLKLKKYYPKFDEVLCVSKYNARQLSNDLGPIVPIDYCYNVIDDIKVRELGMENVEVTLNPNIVNFVSVGRISKEKGYSRLPLIVKHLKDEGYFFKILIIGDGALLPSIKQDVYNLGVTEYFSFLGAQSNPHKYTSKADVFICPSYTEGYSNACTEAAMLGIPVLSTEVPGAQEIVEDAKAGMVVENTDKGIFEGIKSILDNRNLISEWKKQLVISKVEFGKEKRKQHLFNILRNEQ